MPIFRLNICQYGIELFAKIQNPILDFIDGAQQIFLISFVSHDRSVGFKQGNGSILQSGCKIQKGSNELFMIWWESAQAVL